MLPEGMFGGQNQGRSTEPLLHLVPHDWPFYLLTCPAEGKVPEWVLEENYTLIILKDINKTSVTEKLNGMCKHVWRGCFSSKNNKRSLSELSTNYVAGTLLSTL